MTADRRPPTVDRVAVIAIGITANCRDAGQGSQGEGLRAADGPRVRTVASVPGPPVAVPADVEIPWLGAGRARAGSMLPAVGGGPT